MLCQWLWSTLLRQELQHEVGYLNQARVRKQRNKPGPSGGTRNDFFDLHEKWNLRNCLLEVDVDIIREIKEKMGGDEVMDFVPQEYAAQAQAKFESLDVTKITLENAWEVFVEMKNVMLA